MDPQAFYDALVRNDLIEIGKALDADPAAVHTAFEKYNNSSPLAVAVSARHADAVRLLLDRGADMHQGNKQGLSAFRMAARNADILEILLNHAPQKKADLDRALHVAAVACNVKSAGLLIRAGADIQAKNTNGLTVFTHFIEDQSTVIHLDKKDGGYTKHLDMLDFLKKSGADFDAAFDGGKKAVHRLAGPKTPDMLVALIDKHGADKDARDDYGNTPLHIAAAFHGTKALKELLERKADVTAENKSGKTALHVAAAHWHYDDRVERLLAAGADPNKQDREKNLPLHYTASGWGVAPFMALLAVTRDVNSKNIRGETPLHLASDRADPAILQALIAAKADINARDCSQDTPVHRAARGMTGYGNSKLLDALKRAPGAKTGIRNNEGKTAAQIERAERHRQKVAKAAYIGAMLVGKPVIEAADSFARAAEKVKDKIRRKKPGNGNDKGPRR